ncbi:MAG TPA: bacteriohemerythrin [Treponemataceae bacterium]|nr:bacteriohemerythrin [Treponemataceae bacterium]
MINVFKWDESLSTGFDEVDNQHKKLIRVIEDVHQAMEAADRDEADAGLRLAKDLKRLTDYTLYHFTEEEDLMRRNGFPGLESHKKEHEAFVAKITAQIKGLAASDAEASFQLYRFLGSWLLAHIARSDQEWAAFISQKA